MGDPAANVVVEKVVDSLFSVAKREIGYVWNCTENVNKLKREVKNLEEMKERIQQRIGEAKSKGDVIVQGVQSWIDEADDHISTAKKFLEQEDNAKKTCLNLQLCVNLGTLRYYGKMAADKAPDLLQHQEDGKKYENCVSIPAPTPGFTDLYQPKNLEQMHTQKLLLNKIIEAITDETVQITGIYGAGGVGKTTLAKEVAASMKNYFDDVVFITVSQNVNVENIKKNTEIAAKRITKGDKILIILDDVWRELELHEVGIPCGKMNGKILLTCRDIKVCVSMNAERKIHVNALPEKEAWTLFKQMAGERVETDVNLTQIAEEVAKKCGGLPLIIKVVGKALKRN